MRIRCPKSSDLCPLRQINESAESGIRHHKEGFMPPFFEQAFRITWLVLAGCWLWAVRLAKAAEQKGALAGSIDPLPGQRRHGG